MRKGTLKDDRSSCGDFAVVMSESGGDEAETGVA